MTGEMVEWFKAAVLKTAEVQASGGSNPSLSAIFFALFSICPEKWKILTFTKTRSLKGFYNFLPCVHETHSDSARRPILPE